LPRLFLALSENSLTVTVTLIHVRSIFPDVPFEFIALRHVEIMADVT